MAAVGTGGFVGRRGGDGVEEGKMAGCEGQLETFAKLAAAVSDSAL